MKKKLSLFIIMLTWSIVVQAQLTTTNLPIIKITTGGTPIADTQILATMTVINNASGTNNISDAPEYNGSIGIEIKGNLTAIKPNYEIETWSSFKENLDVPLMGMGEENDWILLSVYTDRSLLRQLIANQIFTKMGYWAPKLRLVEVTIDDVYKGVYLFGETIKRDIARLDIATLKPIDNWYPEISGGYILKLDDGNNDGFVSAYPPPNTSAGQEIKFRYVEPKSSEITAVQKAWIKSYTDSFENALTASNFQDTTLGWRGYASEKSAMNFFILNEVIGNEEAYRKNMFMWKDKSKKFRFGPLWNADDILANTADCNANGASAWMYQHATTCATDTWQPAFWWEKFLTDTSYFRDMKCLYNELRAAGGALNTSVLHAQIDSIALLLNSQNAQQRNFNLYPIFGQSINDEPLPLSANYAEEVAKIKQYIADRFTFLDAQWVASNCNTTGITAIENRLDNLSISPNPTQGVFNINTSFASKTKIDIVVTNTLGQQVYHKTNTVNSGLQNITIDASQWATGLYLVTVKNTQGNTWSSKVIKK